MSNEMKSKFLTSKIWKLFRKDVYDKQKGKDPLTGSKLVKRFNVHHLDLRSENYKNLDDIERFIGLNPKSHDAVHLIFNVYKKDHDVIKRLENIMKLMEKYSND